MLQIAMSVRSEYTDRANNHSNQQIALPDRRSNDCYEMRKATVLTEVPIDLIEAYAAYFPGPHAQLALASIAAGNTTAQLWEAPQATGPATVLLWDKGNNVLYLAGQQPSDSIRRDLAHLIDAQIRPHAIAAGLAFFKVRALTPAFEERLADLFVGIALQELRIFFYGFEQAQPAPVPASAVANMRLVAIDPALLANVELTNIEQVRAEIRSMWPSEERFCARGFGCAAVAQQQIICWCTAEYVSSTRCGIGIATVREYERRGVATATAAQFVREARRRGVTPHWECRSTNIGSIRVAEKVGFTRFSEERFWTGVFRG
jgi:RimJ/RimL family protein N-acetyltransferase